MYPIISLIETSTLQKFGQRDGPNEAEQGPRQSDVKVIILSCCHPEDGTESDNNDAQYINGYGSVGRAGAATYPVQT